MSPPSELSSLSRRRLLFVSASALALLGAACKSSGPASCTDVSGLEPDELNARNALGYVDRTPDPTKPCIKCQQYVPAPAADQCGGCKVLKGPIHPQGYCKVFAPL